MHEQSDSWTRPEATDGRAGQRQTTTIDETAVDETPVDETGDRVDAADQTPTVDEAPSSDETQASQETPASQETQASQETPASDETPTRDETQASHRTQASSEDLAAAPADPAVPADPGAPVNTEAAADTLQDETVQDETVQDETAQDEPDAQDLMPGDVPDQAIAALWNDSDTQGMRERWRELQLRFIDDPRSVAGEAERLVAEAVDGLVISLNARKDELNDWQDAKTDDTERLRAAVRRYRDFLDHLLGL
jgi:hypothetical protein